MKLKELEPYLQSERISIIDISNPCKRYIFKLRYVSDYEWNYYNSDDSSIDMYDTFGGSVIESIKGNLITVYKRRRR